jgi:hypothetical protein
MKQDIDGQSRKEMEYKANCIHSVNSRLEWRMINYNCKDVQSNNYKMQVQENFTICPSLRVFKKPSLCSLPIGNKSLWLPTVLLPLFQYKLFQEKEGGKKTG